MPDVIEGKLDAGGRKFGLVVSRFNDFVCQRLLEGALDALKRHGADDGDIKVYRTPGSFEIPALAGKIAGSGNFDAVICLGAVIRGGTPHFDYVAAEVSKGVAAVALAADIPVTFGVITDRKSTRLNSSHNPLSRMPSSA